MEVRSRTLLRSAFLAILVAGIGIPAAPHAEAAKPKPRAAFNVVPIVITSVAVEGGQLVAHGLAGSQPFTAPITSLTASPAATPGACPILHLMLGPIHLDLLGLVVDTSEICLNITADPAGGLLGDLLCGIANLLNGGTPLGTILGGLSTAQLTTLLNGLRDLLNQGVFLPLTQSSALAAVSCDVLNLSLGPVHLNVLGLVVDLDDCHGHPVTLDITAQPAGGLLGQLLCNLGNLLNHSNASAQAIFVHLLQIAALIHQLLG